MLNKASVIILLLCLTSCFEEKKSGEQKPKDLTVITFQESAQKEVLQDTYLATLRYEQNGEDVVLLQDNINKKMQYEVDFAKKTADLDVSTGSYNVNQRWDENLKKYNGYNAFQEIILNSKNKEALLKVAQELQQQGFIMNNLESYLSTQKRATYKNELIEEALNRAKDKANIIAKNLAKTNINIAQIDIHYDDVMPYFSKSFQSVSRTDAAMAQPVVEAGKQNVSVNISVTVNLED